MFLRCFTHCLRVVYYLDLAQPRQVRASARLKYLVHTLGIDDFRILTEKYFGQVPEGRRSVGSSRILFRAAFRMLRVCLGFLGLTAPPESISFSKVREPSARRSEAASPFAPRGGGAATDAVFYCRSARQRFCCLRRWRAPSSRFV